MTPFNSSVEEKNEIELSSSTHSSPRRERPTSPKSAILSDKRRTPHLISRATTVKTKELLERVRKLIRTEQTAKFVGADVHHGFADNLDPFMRGAVGQNAVEVSAHAVLE